MDDWGIEELLRFFLEDNDYHDYNDDAYQKSTDNTSDSKQYELRENGRKAWKVHMANDDENALYIINQELSKDPNHPIHLNIKGLVLSSLKRYDEAKEIFDKSLEADRNDFVIENKAKMIKIWANELYNQNKDLKMAINLLNESIAELLKLSKTNEDIESYNKLLFSIYNKLNQD